MLIAHHARLRYRLRMFVWIRRLFRGLRLTLLSQSGTTRSANRKGASVEAARTDRTDVCTASRRCAQLCAQC